MPLGDFELEVLRLLAASRNPDSYVAGATVLNREPASPRTSKHVDVFHDAVESLAESASRDFATLQAAGFEVIETGRRHDAFCRALVRRGGRQTKIEWVFDSAFRFFPVEADPELGWRLDFWDVAVNKVLAFAGRAEIRDWIDVLHLHERHLHLGALAWAGTGKDPGLSPEAIIRWGGRQAVYRGRLKPKQCCGWSGFRGRCAIRGQDSPMRRLRASHPRFRSVAVPAFVREIQLPIRQVALAWLFADDSVKPVMPSPRLLDRHGVSGWLDPCRLSQETWRFAHGQQGRRSGRMPDNQCVQALPGPVCRAADHTMGA